MEDTHSVNTPEVEDEAPRFVLRRLQATDIKPLSAIISKIGVNQFAGALNSPEVMGAFQSLAEKENPDQAEVTYAGVTAALEVVSIIIDNYAKCERDLFAFMGSVAGLKVEDVETLGLDEFTELLVAIVKMEDFERFFKVARRLFQ